METLSAPQGQQPWYLMARDVQETKLGVIYYVNPYRQTSGNRSCGKKGLKLLLSFSANARVVIVHPN